MGVNCKICNRPLTDLVSVERGVGPTCRDNYKAKSLLNEITRPSLFRSAYNYKIVRAVNQNVVVMEDLGGPKSLTNDIENTVLEVDHIERDRSRGCFVVYRDSFGDWDGYDPIAGTFVPLRARNEATAIKRLQRHIGGSD